jgi:C_GCAxxG_C_C family probable redox protein
MGEDEKDEVLDKAFKLSKEYEQTCTGCAQSAVAGLLDALGMENEYVFKAASGLADGIGLSGDGSCGALTGCCMVIGYIFGRERKDHRDMLKPMKSYLLCKELLSYFVKEYGTCRCYDIQTRLLGRTFNLLDPKDLEDAGKTGMIDVCSDVVGKAARKAAEIVLREQDKDR